MENKSQSHKSLIILFESVLAFGLILFSSRVHYQCDPTYSGPRKRSAKLIEYFSYPKRNIEAEAEIIEHRERYIIKRIEFPSTRNVFGTENIRLDYYMQRKPGKFPTVIILPIQSQ